MIRIFPDFYKEFWNFWIFYRFCSFFDFFSPFFTHNWELSQLWNASIEIWSCSCSGVVYNFVSVNLDFVIRMSKKITFHLFREKFVKKFFARRTCKSFPFILIPVLSVCGFFKCLRIAFQMYTRIFLISPWQPCLNVLSVILAKQDMSWLITKSWRCVHIKTVKTLLFLSSYTALHAAFFFT